MGEKAACGLAPAQARTERIVLGVWVTVLIVGVTLLAVLWGGTAFLQSYFYTEASTAIVWQAPVAAVVLTLFYGLWCLLDYGAPGARATYLPYDTIFRFSAEETKPTKDKKPVEHLWAVLKEAKGEKKIPYKRWPVLDGGRATYPYFREEAGGGKGERWPVDKAVAIEVQEDGDVVRYELTKSDNAEYRSFVSPEGWTIREYNSGPTGQPEAFRTGLWLVNLLLNFGHFALWFLCLWLVLRFQWGHALGLAFVLWLVMTILVVPMMLADAGKAAEEGRGTQRQASAHRESPRVATRGLDAKRKRRQSARGRLPASVSSPGGLHPPGPGRRGH
jgi:hypothetical protein